jgi:hypothetical protein
MEYPPRPHQITPRGLPAMIEFAMGVLFLMACGLVWDYVWTD